MNKDIEMTPMMKQFMDIKSKHPDAILLFRCGDFYETYSTDAIEASEILGITLTKRNNGKNNKTLEMAGFPYHALDTYLPKLVRSGRRVAICDQLEDPKTTRKLVKRGITELVTPGVTINDTVLHHKENNFLAAVHFGKGSCGVAFLDISTGEFLTAEGTFDYVDKLLHNFSPKEILFERGKRGQFEGNFTSRFFYFRDGGLGLYRSQCPCQVAESFPDHYAERVWGGTPEKRYGGCRSHFVVSRTYPAYPDRTYQLHFPYRGRPVCTDG